MMKVGMDLHRIEGQINPGQPEQRTDNLEGGPARPT
jgi:hypothetical protein